MMGLFACASHPLVMGFVSGVAASLASVSAAGAGAMEDRAAGAGACALGNCADGFGGDPSVSTVLPALSSPRDAAQKRREEIVRE